MILEKPYKITDSKLQKIITILSIFITCRVIYIQHGSINDDSVLYFEMARLFTLGQWKEGTALFNWPLYPALISGVHQLTHFSLQVSAQILDVLFFAITVFSYISLIRVAGGNKITILCGTLLLFSSSYIVGDVLAMLLRDQGFWAMFLTSLVYFIKYYRDQKLRDALLWQVCAIVAVLFRIEAITFLICLPFILFLQPGLQIKKRVLRFLKLNLIPISLFIVIIGLLIIMPSIHLKDFGRLQEVVTIFPKLFTDFSQTLKIKANIMSEIILNSNFDSYGMFAVVITLISMIIIKVISLASWPVIGVFLLDYYNKINNFPTHKLNDDANIIFLWVSSIAMLNAFVIVSSVFLLSSRYIVSIGFIILIFSAFKLAKLFENIKINSTEQYLEKILLSTLILLMIFSIGNNLASKPAGRTYEQDAVTYLKTMRVPNEKVFYVTPKSRYFAAAPYAGRGYDSWEYTKNAIEVGEIYKYEYLMLNINVDDQLPAKQKLLAFKLMNYKILKEFNSNGKKKKVIIYKKIIN